MNVITISAKQRVQEDSLLPFGRPENLIHNRVASRCYSEIVIGSIG